MALAYPQEGARGWRCKKTQRDTGDQSEGCREGSPRAPGRVREGMSN